MYFVLVVNRILDFVKSNLFSFISQRTWSRLMANSFWIFYLKYRLCPENVFFFRAVFRKPLILRLFAYAKTKPQISCVVAAQLISAFGFATWIVQILYYLNPKFQAMFCGCTAWFVSYYINYADYPQHMILYIFYHFNSNPRFSPFLLSLRCKLGVTFIRNCYHL